MLEKYNIFNRLEHSLRRRIEALTHPYGINLFPKAHPPNGEGDKRQDVFDEIFNKNLWGSASSRSGIGSELVFTQNYRAQLVEIIRQRNIRSMIDAPCGDLLWMKEVLRELDINYIGGDISPSLVSSLINEFSHLDIRLFDICVDPFPDVDLWHCRDCFFHLPNKDIFFALKNFSRSNIPWILVTSHKSRIHKNLDVAVGGFRFLDLEKAPFNLSPATARLIDYEKGKQFPRFVGLWSRQAIAEAIKDR
jgi:hypothetical protein